MSSPVEHFKVLLWKNLIIEMDSTSKYFINLGIIVLLGIAFGSSVYVLKSASYVQLLLSVFLFFQCGFVGRMVALNLIRDRKIKFRLTLQLVGVRQSIYLASNMIFSVLFGIIQMILTLVSLFIFGFLFSLMINQPSTSEKGFEFDFSSFSMFLISSILFLMAYVAMCAAFSGLVNQYVFAGDIVGKFTFITTFVPLAYIGSALINFLTVDHFDPDKFSQIGKVNWWFFWLPNLTYMSSICKNIMDSSFAKTPAKDIIKTDSQELFYGVLFLQFLGYVALYYIIDRLIAQDTGAQRQFFSSAPNTIPEESEENSGPRDPLLASSGGHHDAVSLKVRDLIKKYGNFTALDNVSLDLAPNSITCLLGHNGAGKTTLIDIMTGFQSPTEGGVYLNGSNVHTNPDMLYGKVGYASSHDPLFEEITVKNFLILIAKLKGYEDALGEATLVANETNLMPHFEKKIKECSGGTKRRVSIAASLVGDPSVVFLDEPSTGVDPENRRALWEAISAMKKPSRIILLTTHHLEEAEFLSRDVIILSKGRVSIRGSPDSIKEELGVGYKFTIGGLGPSELSSLTQTLSPFNMYFDLKDHRLQTIGEVEVVMKNNSEAALTGVLGALTNTDLKFSIHASTLEDAFINLGESEVKDGSKARTHELIESIFHKKFQTEPILKFKALLLRKFYLLVRSVHQIIIIILLIAVPSFTFYLITSFVYAVSKSFNSQGDKLLPSYYFTVLNIICILYYSFSCGFFGITPVTERLDRIRYLMKMNNVSFLSYFPALLLPDLLISMFLIAISYALSYLMIHTMMRPIEFDVLLLLGFSLFLWMTTFIVQSYCASYLFSSKPKAVKYLAGLIILLNFISIQIFGIIATILQNSQTVLDVIQYIIYVLFPMYPNITYCQISLSRGRISTSDLTPCVIQSMISFVLFFALAIFLDYRDSKIKASENLPVVQDNAQVFDPLTVSNEKTEAYRDTNEHPLQIRGVYKSFPSGLYALSDVNLVLKKGEVLGLIGPNGAGKSTLFNIISNYLTPTSGHVRYNGKSLNEAVEFYDMTGLCAQDDIIWPELSVDQHLNFYAELKGIDEQTVLQWKELIGLDGFGDFSSTTLSTGMKRKLCYIISMMSNPEYKFLDEPTSGLDPVSRKLMRQLVTAQKRIYGGSCVFTTHTMTDAEDLCDRVAIVINGKLNTVDTVSNLRSKTGGLNVSFVRNLATTDLEGEERYLAALFAQVFPECLEGGLPIITDKTERKVVFFAANLSEKAILGKMTALFDLKKKGQLYDFEISQRSLEDLFMYLARFQRPRAN